MKENNHFLKITHALIFIVNAVLILDHRHTFDETLKLFYNHAMNPHTEL